METVKVYKGDSVVTINKSELELWNDAGYKTSSQQKKKKGDSPDENADKAE